VTSLAELVEATRTLDELIHRPRWHADALCREHPQINWFPRKGEANGAARAVCSRCPVRGECLAFALAYDDAERLHGIWGGTTAHERRVLKLRETNGRRRPRQTA
jgi:WhiB family redox-sensing transcriptional regulator